MSGRPRTTSFADANKGPPSVSFPGMKISSKYPAVVATARPRRLPLYSPALHSLFHLLHLIPASPPPSSTSLTLSYPSP
ncbi:hypothetical protein E2C01_061369 [Portunus trituberculatus]|uniref:Uncharacterized protein n=1 Tax=Portunus trituberculatus TaxID=210409 RepID=A0A5B7H504_PORTR|nr:hypothetical protein [Portunus trituberculatus]